MDDKILNYLTNLLDLPRAGIQAVLALSEEGATVPFMARYRKERTGSLDEVALRQIIEATDKYRELAKRREAILKSLRERDLLTEDLERKLTAAAGMTELEDLYRPLRPKRRTRGTIAEERGLSPLADSLLQKDRLNPRREAERFVDPERGVDSVDEALAGACDILAERISDDAAGRQRLRRHLREKGVLRIQKRRGAALEGTPYQDLPGRREKLSGVPAHRFMSYRRGEKEGFLSWKLEGEDEGILRLLRRDWKAASAAGEEYAAAARKDSWERLIQPSLERELIKEKGESADRASLEVFRENLKELLLESPYGQRAVIALDPGFRTGTKAVILGPQGQLRDTRVIYPIPPQERPQQAKEILQAWVSQYQPRGVAVGNGTGGREVYQFVRSLKLTDPEGVSLDVVLVDERGASIYSASEAARREFPDQDITVRGAVSIGRRLQDPLSELVKIQPESLGIGQYQHDVPSKQLSQVLHGVMEDCVNRVGADVNSAGRELLSCVAGLDTAKGEALVQHREEKGPFQSRTDLKKIKGFGEKTFQQCAGFLRISQGTNPLDATAVHPESYPLAREMRAMAEEKGVGLQELTWEAFLAWRGSGGKKGNWGKETWQDVKEELLRPGRDPREEWESIAYQEDVNSMDDLEEGMVLPGMVTNITAFGAFVDIGVHQDGLVHISEMADHFIRDVHEVLALRDKVRVKVLTVDRGRQRIALTLKNV